MKYKIRSGFIIGLLFALSMPSTPVFASSGLVVSASSILQPDPSDQFDCSSSAIQVLRTDGEAFNYSDRLEITYRFPEVDPPIRQSPMIGFTKNTIPRSMLVDSRKKSAALTYQLCTFYMPSPNVTKMELHVHHKNSAVGLDDIDLATITVDILPREARTLVIENLMDSCQINTKHPFFEQNLIVTQTIKPLKSGGKFSISGTLFRQGVAAPNTTLEFREEKPGEYTKLGKLLGKATTDAKGQFKFSSTVRKYSGYSYTTVEAHVPDQIVNLGPFAFANDEFQFDIDFNWSNGGSYSKSIFDWIPSPAHECKKAYAAYESAYSSDERNNPRIWMYVAKRVFLGSKGKSSRSVSEGFSTGSCYVSGYFRDGTWVNGYFRKC